MDIAYGMTPNNLSSKSLEQISNSKPPLALRGRRPPTPIAFPCPSLGHSNTGHLDITRQRRRGQLPRHGHDPE